MHAEASGPLETELQTARLLLRAPRHADAARITALANDEGVASMTARLPYPYRIEDAHAFIAGRRGLGGGPEAALDMVFVIERLGDGEILGSIGLAQKNAGTATLGFWLGRRHWGAGYATEAARAVVDHLFEATHAGAVVASVRVINEASRRVVEKCGLRYVESGLEPAPARGGALPVDRFRLSRRDWESFKAWRPALVRARTATEVLAPG
ncbi:MAG: GNAT family N-acetyltransferase [Labrys sp. (in: a-proteobacteria)]|jgi:RimJ/RimL family protein N-acetyltransferase